MTLRRAFATAIGVAGVMLATLAVSGCAGGGSAPSDSAESETESALVPFLIDADFPDPDVVAVDDGFLAFATNTYGVNLQMATSPDLESWTLDRTDHLPKLPAWASVGRVWAPEVSRGPDGGLMLYFTAEHTDSGRQCIGVATAAADDADVVFTPASDEPLVCPLEEGGAIDASTFVDDDGTSYLLWKTDGNCCGRDTWIEIAPLAADGLSLAGAPTRLIMQDQEWEGNLVEAPVLVKHDDAYVLFYSANDYGGDQYAIGFATAPSLTGPFTKAADPLLTTSSSGGRYLGPGGQDVVSTPDGDVLVFHSWDEQYVYRGLHTAPLDWDGSTPSVVLPD